MKKNDYIVASVESMGASGEGIFHYDGVTCFVPFVLTNEKVKVKVLKVKNNIAFCKLDEIIEKSEKRITPKCEIFTKCGGCNLQHASYDLQLDIKRQNVATCLKKIARLDVDVQSVVKSPKIYGYRNKLQLPIRDEKGVSKIGFFREGSHDIVETNDCPLHDAWAKTIIKIVKDFIDENKISCYNETTKKGLLKHLVVRCVDENFLITLVAQSFAIPRVNRLIDAFKQVFPNFSLIINKNELHNNVVFGKSFKTVFGSGKIEISEFGIKYEIGAESFLQVNFEQKQNLYNKVLSLCDLNDNTVVIDGYSGAGVLTGILAKKSKMAYGVEIVQEAVDSANDLAVKNGLQNKMQNICADCSLVLPDIIKKATESGDKTVLILDPPRKGVDERVIDQILVSKPDRIVYVSCSPQSLARDLGLIMKTLKRENNAIINSYGDFSDYEITYLSPFDLFAQTKHVECVCLLCKK